MPPIATILALTLVASGSLAAPVASSNDKESIRLCIDGAERAMNSLEVPERISRLVGQLRRLNPKLRHFSLVKFADGSLADLRPLEWGLIKAADQNSLAELCASYVAQVYSALVGARTCGRHRFRDNYDLYELYLEEAAKHSNYDRKLGAAKLCTQF